LRKLPEDLDSAFEKFLRDIFFSLFEYTRLEERMFREVSEKEFTKLSERQSEVYTRIDEILPPVREARVRKMRQTLGSGIGSP
jgi:hypothetical protein